MNLRSMQLYVRMQEEISKVESCCHNEMMLVEECFTISLGYWNRIKQVSESCMFGKQADEIHFFKHIKPLFIASMEYYMLLYQAVLFRPAHDNEQLLSYWLYQLQRVEKFMERNRDFCEYYHSGQTDRDAAYFMRPKNLHHVPGKSSCKYTGPLPPGYTAACLIGYRKYRLYIEQELEKLIPKNKKERVKGTLHSFTAFNNLSPGY